MSYQMTTKQVNNLYHSTHHNARIGKNRKDQLLPFGTPRWIRIYDDPGCFDRYTVVFTGRRGGYYVGMSSNPTSPSGFYQHGESNDSFPVDKPVYSHLGKKIHFTQLPYTCQKVIRDEYCQLWEIDITPQQKLLWEMQSDLESDNCQFYWEYDDKLTDEQIAKIFEKPDGLWEVQDEMYDYNIDYICQLEDEAIKQVIENYYDELEDIHAEDTEIRVAYDSWEKGANIRWLVGYYRDALIDFVHVDLNIDDLIKNSDVRVNAELSDIYDLECLGDNTYYYDDLANVLSLLKINPRKFADSLDLSNKTEFPNYKYRDGQEMVDIDEFCNEFYNFRGSWARVVFSVNLDFQHYAHNREMYQKGIVIPKGTTLWLLDGFYAGTCSIGECDLQKPLTLKTGQYNLTMDGQYGWGLNDICGLTNDPWNQREVKPV